MSKSTFFLVLVLFSVLFLVYDAYKNRDSGQKTEQATTISDTTEYLKNKIDR